VTDLSRCLLPLVQTHGALLWNCEAAGFPAASQLATLNLPQKSGAFATGML
jgi:hypothetical protein